MYKTIIVYYNYKYKETIKALDAKQSMYIYSEKINSKQEYRTLSSVYFDTIIK